MKEIYSVSSLTTKPVDTSPQRRITVSNRFAASLTAAQGTPSDAASIPESYVVRPGDSLYRIAARLKENHGAPQSVTVLVREMTALKHLVNPNLIHPGQVLKLPVSPSYDRPMNPPSPDRSTTNIITPVFMTSGETPTPDLSAVETQPRTKNLDTALSLQQGNGILPAVMQMIVSAAAQSGDNDNAVAGKVAADMPIASEPDALPFSYPSAVTKPPHPDLQTQIIMYKDDQLLAHPGGDAYFLNRETEVYAPSFDQSRFVNRVGKDLADAGSNLLNIAKDLALGAPYKYLAETGEIKTAQEVGLLGTLKNFAEDVFSGLSFGAYVPEGEAAPEGVLPSIGHFFKKILYEAPIRDLLIGVPHAAVNVIKDAALASLNLLEVIPDATIGNFEWGQKATTTVFDNGQVVVDYLTDVLPGGNAWLRVHAAGPRGDMEPPVYFNLTTSEQGITDSRWSTVRNTPFRKTIETIGSLLSDAAIAVLTTHTFSPSSDQRHD